MGVDTRSPSSNFASNALFEPSLERFTSTDDMKMNYFQTYFYVDFVELKDSFKSIEDFCNCHGEADSKRGTMFARIAEAAQKGREKLSSIENKVKALATQNQVVVSNIPGFGSPAPHVSTFYRTASGPVEVEPAPEFRSVEAINPGGLVAMTNTALKMVKSTTKKPRHRDRKKKKPQVPVKVVKTEDPGKIPDDGYSWRKYGSKNIKTAIYKKQYYRCNAPCARYKNERCRARRTVQQANSDPTVLHVVYDMPHSCKLAQSEGPSEIEVGKEENLNLADHMLVNDSGSNLADPPAANWTELPLDEYSVLRTSSGNFSAVSEEEIGEIGALANLKGDGADFTDLSGDLCDLISWPDAKSQYLEVEDNQVLMEHIAHQQSMADPQEQESTYRNNFYMTHIQDWHPHGS